MVDKIGFVNDFYLKSCVNHYCFDKNITIRYNIYKCGVKLVKYFINLKSKEDYFLIIHN